ncbi:hypothetical protein [Nevskia soli]|uniref:hypothetical protein n=1 Tax=Nevskia soli TaxID=418856 RepID=UPI00068AE043|nr:hypothetical protein [Nevskia soli]
MRFDHVPPGTVRFWAWVDSSVTLTLAIPPVAVGFLHLLYRVNGWLGGQDVLPEFAPIHLFFVCLSGVLISLWVLVRLLHPVGVLAFADAMGRAVVASLIVYFLVCTDAPRVLGLFVFTELAGSVAQFRAVLRQPAHPQPDAARIG